MSTPAAGLNEYSARLATFHTPHHLEKRRASNATKTKKKQQQGTVEWPHEFPSPEGLARAGFFYKPAHDSEDNVQCFSCHVKLDGWEPADDPISEHLAHSHGCAWATVISVIRDADSQQPPEQRDPLSEEIAGARYATFQTGNGWPHEGKKGWKCKISKMVDAGWAWDPNDEGEDGDGTTCFYCDLSLDGWEPKDDPFVEHKRREPACPYFALLEHYHGPEIADGKSKKAKARGKAAAARSSTASKASRMSVQSVQSVQSAVSEMPSMGGSFAELGGDDDLPGADDGIVTTATTASQTTKGKKKAVKAKATTKGAKGRKKVDVEEDAIEVNYPELSQPAQDEDDIVIAPAKATRKVSKPASRHIDSSVVEISQIDVAPPKKAPKGRKPKVQKQPEPEPELKQEEIPQTPDADAIAEKRLSEISAQLQDELDHTVEDYPLDQSTPVQEAPKPKRGVKRTSDGARKHQSSDSSAFEVDVPALSKAQPVVKAKRGRKPKQASTASTDAEQETQPVEEVVDMDTDVSIQSLVEAMPEPPTKKPRGRPKGKKNSAARSSQASLVNSSTLEPEAQPDELESHENEPKAVLKKARGRPKGSKNSSARSSQLSQQIADPEEPAAQPTWPDLPVEDPARDEMEIEASLVRIASEQASHQAMETEQDHVDEYETSPSQGRLSKDSAEIQQLQQEIHQEDLTSLDKSRGADSAPRLSLGLEANSTAFTFSPSGSGNGSDKENQPSSLLQHSSTGKSVRKESTTQKESEARAFMSPTKTTRIPLAPGTPNRSPTRGLRTSPSKAEISRLQSNVPWKPVDLDTVLLGNGDVSPGRVERALVMAAGGGLSEQEKRMTVEEWVRWRAEVVEAELRRKCEGMVGAFEREGLRGLGCLEGIEVSG